MSKGQSEMTDHAAFIRNICERTALGLDTTAERLAFADWLKEYARSTCSRCFGTGSNDIGHSKGPVPCMFCVEHGAERAELIRCQVELSTSHKQDWCECILDPESRQVKIRCKPCLLRHRESEILATNVSRWIDGPHNPLLGMRPDQIEWRGGFPVKVRCSFREWCGEAFGQKFCPPIYCHGSGRIDALGPAIVAVAPIEEFEATDSIMTPEIASVIWGPHNVGSSERGTNNRRALEWAREKWLGTLRDAASMAFGPID
jgi:uncharacterized protein (TIGR02996 family)